MMGKGQGGKGKMAVGATAVDSGTWICVEN